MSTIKRWIEKNGYQISETRTEHEAGYVGPDGSFLVLNAGQNEAPFWNYYSLPTRTANSPISLAHGTKRPQPKTLHPVTGQAKGG